MTKEECWKKFSQTGYITDYLAYAGIRTEDVVPQRNSREDCSNTYAGFNRCDGDDSQIGTDR